jgi:hypothetical protein
MFNVIVVYALGEIISKLLILRKLDYENHFLFYLN